jgi:hypothetical protein
VRFSEDDEQITIIRDENGDDSDVYKPWFTKPMPTKAQVASQNS